jgi:hypothetical protein
VGDISARCNVYKAARCTLHAANLEFSFANKRLCELKATLQSRCIALQ